MTNELFEEAYELDRKIELTRNFIHAIEAVPYVSGITLYDNTNDKEATGTLPENAGVQIKQFLLGMLRCKLVDYELAFSDLGPVPAIDDSWHPVSEVPPADRLYMICTEKGAVYFASPDGDTWNKHIKYWKPIPPLPEEFGEQKPNNQ